MPQLFLGNRKLSQVANSCHRRTIPAMDASSASSTHQQTRTILPWARIIRTSSLAPHFQPVAFFLTLFAPRQCFYLNVVGTVGHPLTAVLEGPSGYHRHWAEYGQVYSGCIHVDGGMGSIVHATDGVTGDTGIFGVC
jgi:hypothetical protein